MTAKRKVHILGDPAVLDRPKVALFCSVKCPGKLILATYDLVRQFRQEGTLVISPFHSPMEQECLRILLRSPHPVIWALARGLYKQVPSTPIDCRPAVKEGRLIMATPFPANIRRITTETATTRNYFAAELATAVFVAHAAPGSKMEVLCKALLASGKPVYTFNDAANEHLLAVGAQDVATLARSSPKGREA